MIDNQELHKRSSVLGNVKHNIGKWNKRNLRDGKKITAISKQILHLWLWVIWRIQGFESAHPWEIEISIFDIYLAFQFHTCRQLVFCMYNMHSHFHGIRILLKMYSQISPFTENHQDHNFCSSDCFKFLLIFLSEYWCILLDSILARHGCISYQNLENFLLFWQ